MRQVIFMTVKYTLHYLPDKSTSRRLVQIFQTRHVLQQITSLKVFHDDDNLHIFHSQTFVNFNNILMLQRF